MHCIEIANMISGNASYALTLLEASFFGP